jgi:hypothetical protein
VEQPVRPANKAKKTDPHTALRQDEALFKPAESDRAKAGSL